MALTPSTTFPRSSDGSTGNIDFIDGSTTLYVSTTGSDSNVGTEASPFLTVQGALDAAGAAVVSPGSVITIQLADGTYVNPGGNTLVPPPFVDIVINGNSSSITSTVLRQSAAFAVVAVSAGAQKVTLTNLTLDSSTSGAQGIASGQNSMFFIGNIQFGSNLTSGHIVMRGASVGAATGNITIAASTARHLSIVGQCNYDCVSRTVTLTGTPAFSSEFVLCSSGYARFDGCTFSGSATGQRYEVNQSGTIFVNGAGANFLPGNSAGAAATQGQYI